MKVLVTGGAGFIGTHTLIELVAAGYEPVVVDNLSNSSPEALRRVEGLTGLPVPFYQADLRNKDVLDHVFTENDIRAVIHFAGLKAVGESVASPLLYYRTNLDATLSLLESMSAHGVKNLVFSSSATVYGRAENPPFSEDLPRQSTNPYGWTKVMIEQMLEDVTRADAEWSITALRYFNPVGAHPSGMIGEVPSGVPNNLLPYVSQVAFGQRDHVSVFGDDYDTPDGTGVRDYIHVVDLARAHVAALAHLSHPGHYKVYNIGTGQGVSVLEVIRAFERASGRAIPYEITQRRPGDVASSYASPVLASQELGWTAKLSIDQACSDAWNWQVKNPNGFGTVRG
ncbi:MAG: UDP-glucose 4-epimerase GalE [Ancrocorticia sp.]|uniref:UDP-glucose 4-epimerase GalE n=1 Tax=Ancrocorticia sp. TaxID=2593684 RepID=UPI003F8E1C98